MIWNPVLDYFMNIKYLYNAKFGLDTYDVNVWVDKLKLRDKTSFFDSIILNQYNDLLMIRYDLRTAPRDMWENKDSILRECRSVVIDLRKERVVFAPMKKFFNIGEVEENSIENLYEEMKICKPTFTNKLDGSMQMARCYNGEIIMSGSMALDREKSWRLDEGYKLLTKNHKKMIEEYPYFTFTFEFIHPDDVHVVKYDKKDSGLHLIGIRDSEIGTEFSYQFVKSIGDKFNVKCVEIEELTFDEVLRLSKVYKSDEKEGWVMYINGRRVKIKCDDYLAMHSIVDKLSSDSRVIESIANNTYDDMLSRVPDSYKDMVKDKHDKVKMYIMLMNNSINLYYNIAPKEDKKEFMIWVEKTVPKHLRGFVRSKYFGKDIDVLKLGNSRMVKMSEIEKVLDDEAC